MDMDSNPFHSASMSCPPPRSVRAWTILLALALVATRRSTTPPTIETGEIGGAKFPFARPALWNRNILLLAHGHRAEDRPLVADLFPEQLSRKALLDEGWIIAKTSFRRNGIIIVDAIADLDALRANIAERLGPPNRARRSSPRFCHAPDAST